MKSRYAKWTGRGEKADNVDADDGGRRLPTSANEAQLLWDEKLDRASSLLDVIKAILRQIESFPADGVLFWTAFVLIRNWHGNDLMRFCCSMRWEPGDE